MNTTIRPRPIALRSVRCDDRTLYVELADGTCLTAALTQFPRLLRGSKEERQEWQSVGAGTGIHWPLLDEDISIAGLKRDQAQVGSMHPAMREVFEIVGEMYDKSDKLSSLTGGRRFTLDGVFVATTGHVVAEYIYGLQNGTPHPRTPNGESVQVSLIGGSSKKFSFSTTMIAHQMHADYLLCLRKGSDGFEEIYNGPFPKDLLADRSTTKGRQVSLSASLLQEENPAVLGKQNSFASINHLFRPKLSHAA